MAADPRGAEGTAAIRRWYLEVSGRRAGPFAWTVLVELAQGGALAADDRVWRMGLASWCRTAELADLAALMRAPAPARTFSRAGYAGRDRARALGYPPPGRALGAPAAGDRRQHSPPEQRSCGRIAGRSCITGDGIRATLPVPQRAAASRAITVRSAGSRRAPRGQPPCNRQPTQRAGRRGRRRHGARAAGRCRRRQRASAARGVANRCAALPVVGPGPVCCDTRLQSSASGPVRSAAALAAISPALAALLDAPADAAGRGGIPRQHAATGCARHQSEARLRPPAAHVRHGGRLQSGHGRSLHTRAAGQPGALSHDLVCPPRRA